MLVKVTKNNRITLPIQLRKKYGLKKGSKLQIITKGNAIFLKPINRTKSRNDLKNTFGTLKMNKPTQQIMDEIDEGYD